MTTGRPPKYKAPEEMQEVIDEYFKDCEGEPLKNKDGEYVINKYGEMVIIGAKPPTITGLALALGFTSRLALLNYQEKEAFVNTVTRAKAKVEAYAESRLFDKDGANGAKFSLANNFRGWKEQQRHSHSGPDGGAIPVLHSYSADMTKEERARLVASIREEDCDPSDDLKPEGTD